MKTICMATHADMEHEDCLKCSLQPHGCDYNYALLKAVFDAQSRGRSPGIHVSDIKACPLKYFYKQTKDTIPFYPSERMSVSQGTIMHEEMAGDGEDPNLVAEKEIRWVFGGVEVIGSFDAYYPEQKLLSDTKTTRWLTPRKLPYGDHKEQVRIYAVMMNHLGYEVERAEIQYVDMSGASKCTTCKGVTLLPYSDTELRCPNCTKHFAKNMNHLGAVRFEVDLRNAEETEAWITERAIALQTAIDTNEAPAAEPSIMCSYCDFRKDCPSALRI